MWGNLPLFVTRTIDLIKQYSSLEEVTQAITQMASHSDLTDEMKYSCFHTGDLGA